jgi:tetratricopeptide (TPR) repeat protein
MGKAHPGRAIRLVNLAAALQGRSAMTGDTVDLRDAINSARQALSLTPKDHPSRDVILANLRAARQMQRRASQSNHNQRDEFATIAIRQDLDDGTLALEIEFARVFRLTREGRASEALRRLDALVERYPNRSDIWLEKSTAEFQAGDFESAIRSCNKVLELYPDDVFAWRDKGLCLAELGRYDEAIQHYERAIILAQAESEERPGLPWRTDTLVELGKSLAKLGRHTEAIKVFEKVTRERAHHGNAWHQMALSYEQLGERDHALASFDTALSLDNKDADTWNNRGAFFARIGLESLNSKETDENNHGITFLREAVRCWDNALIANPKQKDARRNLDQVLSLTGADFRQLATAGLGPPDIERDEE